VNGGVGVMRTKVGRTTASGPVRLAFRLLHGLRGNWSLAMPPLELCGCQAPLPPSEVLPAAVSVPYAVAGGALIERDRSG
jgi:hypothetical protein